jgi:hypothetical protein
MIETFISNRELALIIWLIIFAGYGLVSSGPMLDLTDKIADISIFVDGCYQRPLLINLNLPPDRP